MGAYKVRPYDSHRKGCGISSWDVHVIIPLHLMGDQ